MTGRFEQMSEATIKVLVDEFHVRVRRDLALGPMFARAIAADPRPARLTTFTDYRLGC